MRLTSFCHHFTVDFYTGFYRFLRIVPRTTCVVLEDGPHHTTHTNTCHIASKRFGTKNKSYNYWSNDCQQSWQHHFFQRCFCRDVHTFSIFWRSGSFHNTWNFTELTPYFFHHFHGSFSNRLHRQGRENYWYHTSYE